MSNINKKKHIYKKFIYTGCIAIVILMCTVSSMFVSSPHVEAEETQNNSIVQRYSPKTKNQNKSVAYKKRAKPLSGQFREYSLLEHKNT